MDEIDKKFIQKLFKDSSGAMVGKLCKQNETVQKNLKKRLQSNSQYSEADVDYILEILKDFNRELVYESFREIFNHIKCYAIGKTYNKYKIYTPTKQ